MRKMVGMVVRWRPHPLIVAAGLHRDDCAWLAPLLRLPYLLTRHAHCLGYPERSLAYVQKRLSLLAQRGLLRRTRVRLPPEAAPRHPGAAWYLTPIGRATVAALYPRLQKDLALSVNPQRSDLLLSAAVLAASEAYVLCLLQGLDFPLTLPGEEMRWLGWPVRYAEYRDEPPPLAVVHLGHWGVLLDFLRPEETASSWRLLAYRSLFENRSSVPNWSHLLRAALVVGWHHQHVSSVQQAVGDSSVAACTPADVPILLRTWHLQWQAEMRRS